MSEQLRVDPIRCSAHGMCAELLPERVRLDDWGYPMIDDTPITPELAALARRAVDTCPVFALRLERAEAVSVRRRRPAGAGSMRR